MTDFFTTLNAGRLSLVLAAIACVLALGVVLQVLPLWLVLVLLLAMLGFALMLIYSQTEQQKAQTQVHARLQALTSRQAAIIATQNRAYALFDMQGQLQDAHDMPRLLQIQRFGHLDDLVNAVADGADLLTAFRRLQLSGQGFVVRTTTLAGGHALVVRGQRFQGATTRDSYDCVWLRDNAEVQGELDKAATQIAAAEQATADTYALLDQCAFPLWVRSADLRLVWCNLAYAKACEAERPTVIANQQQFFTPASHVALKAMQSRTLALNLPQRELHQAVLAGRRHQFEVVMVPVPASASGEQRLLGYALDTTQQENLDQQLQMHINAHHEVLENLAVPIAIYAADQRLSFYNRAYVRLWDHEESFLQSRPTFGDLLEDLRSRRRAPEQTDFQRYKRERVALFTNLLEPREDMMHLPDGSTLRIMAMPHPFGGVMFVHEDVTDKLALEASYNTMLAVQRETLDHLSEGIAVFGDDGRLKLFNPAFVNIWQLDADLLANEPHISELLEQMKPLLRFENWTQFKSELIGATLDRNPQQRQFVRADESVISTHTVPLPDGAVLNSYLDVTATVKIEQALRASNAALAAADRLKSEFVANVSYQLRTPLNTIMGFAEILLNQYFGTLNEKQLEYTRTLLESSRRLKSLIDDVLDVALLEAGRMTLERKPIAVAALLQQAAQTLHERVRQHGLSLQLDLPAGLGQFEVDERRLRQTLVNLLTNAVQYTPPGGKIVLQARRDENYITIKVSDTGMGIPLADQARVWGKFERANPGAGQAGVGLGLVLVRAFVELHGGRIELQSMVNEGTTIILQLPIRAIAATPSA